MKAFQTKFGLWLKLLAANLHDTSSLLWVSIVRLCWLNVVAQKRRGRPKRVRDEVLVNDKKRSLECILLTFKPELSGEDAFEEDLSDKSNPLWRKTGFKMDDDDDDDDDDESSA